MTKTIPKKNKHKKTKWPSEEDLQTIMAKETPAAPVTLATSVSPRTRAAPETPGAPRTRVALETPGAPRTPEAPVTSV